MPHPTSKHPLLKFAVYVNGRCIAAFHDETEACGYAKQLGFAEVVLRARRGGGLVAQYSHGKTTAEFAAHEAARDDIAAMKARIAA